MRALRSRSLGEGGPVEDKEGGRRLKNTGTGKDQHGPIREQTSWGVCHVVPAREIRSRCPGAGRRIVDGGVGNSTKGSDGTVGALNGRSDLETASVGQLNNRAPRGRPLIGRRVELLRISPIPGIDGQNRPVR